MLGEHNYSNYKVNKHLVKERISTRALRVGMYVTELDRPWIETPFLFQGFVISSEDEIDQLCEYCEYVYIDMSQTHVAYNTERALKASKSRSRDLYKVSVEKELAVSSKQFDYAKATVTEALGALKLAGDLDTQQVKDAVKGCIESVVRNPNALLWLTQIKKQARLHC